MRICSGSTSSILSPVLSPISALLITIIWGCLCVEIGESVQCYKCSTQGPDVSPSCHTDHASLGTESCDGFCYTYMTLRLGAVQGTTRRCQTQTCVATSNDGTAKDFTGVVVKCCQDAELCNDATMSFTTQLLPNLQIILLSLLTTIAVFFITDACSFN
ncbi:uncharacterized protein LOC142345751 [Convolutriloba macropyga]|uniref:uncharacterized protein LOC142345751 n=1 Tax=Convolutriloba macropyga TaxID=536237 RepID=UPI003F52397E